MVVQDVVRKSAELFERFDANVHTEFNIDTAHGIPTLDAETYCTDQDALWLNCDYSAAEVMLKWLHRGLADDTKKAKKENFFKFD